MGDDATEPEVMLMKPLVGEHPVVARQPTSTTSPGIGEKETNGDAPEATSQQAEVYTEVTGNDPEASQQEEVSIEEIAEESVARQAVKFIITFCLLTKFPYCR